MNKENAETKIILLGGHDLEMLTIKELLQGRKDCLVVDKYLNWNNALLSAYKEVLSRHEDAEFYGIELKEDIHTPKRYHLIDHHNERSRQKSSLEQVSEIFSIQLNRHQLLVTANDKGHIPGMKSIGASEEEIQFIRRLDREAQGATEADEQLAEQSIKESMEHKGNLTIVYAKTNKFSCITDRLYPYEKLLVYNDSEWTYYGTGKKQLVNHFRNEIEKGLMYHGGTDDGYIGAGQNTFTQDEINEQIKYIKNMATFSYHNFMFPFRWSIKGFDDKTFSEQIDLNGIISATGTNWERVTLKTTELLNEQDRNTLYNERNYFYEFVHDALYDNGNDEGKGNRTLVHHYERKEPKHGEVKYIIQCKTNKGTINYELSVKSINLNLYSTGVGILSFYLHNEKYPEARDVMRINQKGRRIFPPHIGDVDQRYLIAEKIELQGLHSLKANDSEDFSRYTNKTACNVPACFITGLIHEQAQNIEIKPVIDDRMFVQCWYKNDQWADEFSKYYNNFLNKSQWYEYVYVDERYGLSCQNDEMQQKIIEKSTYARWQKWKSLYGISRYSMVLLTNTGCPDYLLTYFETEYVRMAELILVQKASVLRFSAEVTNISNMEDDKNFSRKASSLYKEYIRFVNQIHFREVSAQDQGIELYQMLYETMNIEKHVDKLDEEIEELYNYVTLQQDRKSNDKMSVLTLIATIALPATFMAGFFGMNNCAFHDNGDDWYNSFWWQFIIIIALTIIGYRLIYSFLKRKEK